MKRIGIVVSSVCIINLFAVHPVYAQCDLDQMNDYLGGSDYSSGGFLSQTFTPGVTGMLCTVYIHADIASSEATLTVYPGEGFGETPLHTQTANLDVGWTAISLSGNVEVFADSLYTMRLDNVSAWSLIIGTNPYPGGRAETSPNDDHCFKTYVFEAGVPAISKWVIFIMVGLLAALAGVFLAARRTALEA